VTAAFERVTDDTLVAGELRAARLADGTPLCVGYADGRLFAVRDECPHSACPLSNGTLLPGARLECGWHGAQFDCRTGAVLEGPADDPLVRYEVRVDDGGVFVSAAAIGA
jgi:nitrite reductase/ring-hydroxylating ferredoxin subunit